MFLYCASGCWNSQSTRITTPHHNSWDLVDKDWQWTRSEIAKLIEIICKAADNGGSRYSVEDLRKPIWALLSALCRDPAGI